MTTSAAEMEKSTLLYAVGTAAAVVIVVTSFKMSDQIRKWIWMNWKVKKKTLSLGDKETEEERQLNLRKPPDIWNTALFFPDTSPDREDSPTKQFISYFENAKISIYICIHLFSEYNLAGVIVKKKKEGLVVKVVTDFDRTDGHNDNASIRYLQIQGVEVRTKNTGYLMHNKFAIIDDEAVISGSTNWTLCAFSKNTENAIVTTQRDIVDKFRKEFFNLWNEATRHSKRH